MDPAFRDAADAVAARVDAAGLELRDGDHGRALWADGQLDDFLYPERFPDWPDRYRVQLQYRGFRRARLSDLASQRRRPISATKCSASAARGGRCWWSGASRIPTCPFEFSESLMQQMPYARLVAVDDAGHLPQWEKPDIVQPALSRFCARSSPDAPSRLALVGGRCAGVRVADVRSVRLQPDVDAARRQLRPLPSLPARCSDQEFWKLMSDLSRSRTETSDPTTWCRTRSAIRT